MSLDPNKVSIVHWFPDIEKHRCGYCKNDNCSISYGMWAETMTVEDYQNLIDRGWRRSGKYCYKPIMNETCCPQYTIRCDALNFRPSKSQKKIIKKFNKFLSDGVVNKESSSSNNSGNYEVEESDIILKERPHFNVDLSNLSATFLEQAPTKINDQASCSHEEEEKLAKKVKVSNEKEKSTDAEVNTTKKGMGIDPSKPPCKKAKLIRLERKLKKLQEHGVSKEMNRTNSEAKTLEQFVNEIPSDCKHKLKTNLISVGSDSKEWLIEYEVYKKYQMMVHNDPPEKCSQQAFTRFLVNSPLKSEIENDDNDDFGLGSFHQQYWIDDKLIAVGVIDILPKCISSVYFFYDPDYRNLTLGTYGSLRELEFTRSLHTKYSSIEYYYMGFYIHSCPKMRYKGNLNPSELLCPETYFWFPIEKCIPKLDKSKYSRLNEDPAAVDENTANSQDIDTIKILFGYSFTIFRNYKFKNRNKEVFENIGRLVGKKCIDTLLFVHQKH